MSETQTVYLTNSPWSKANLAKHNALEANGWILGNHAGVEYYKSPHPQHNGAFFSPQQAHNIESNMVYENEAAQGD